MQAAFIKRFGAPEVIEIGELPRPKPGPGEVLLEVRAADANDIRPVVDAVMPLDQARHATERMGRRAANSARSYLTWRYNGDGRPR